ncbi:MAG TPA: low specificity L-threonine aldolase [Steroidobacteraceae bacterium]|nr:low specificity L-threonine aldolase [Steroidobacteraceae bacterium]
MSTTSPTAGSGASFRSDNDWGASPQIVAAIADCNDGTARPYGADDWTRRVEERFCQIFERPVGVLLVATGTAANSLSLAAVTPPWGSVICHRSAHINTDECGAPEFYTGAKLVTSASGGSKLDPSLLEAELAWGRGDVHSVQAACVSITQATEDGQAYTAAEIARIGALCRAAGARLHMDGARFANALVALGATPADITWRAGVDLLSFGASKNGALNAEAIVVFDETLMAKLPYLRKRAGHLTSKMRFLAAQMQAYLERDLWLVNARAANAMALRLAEGLSGVRGAELTAPALTNILFMRLSDELSVGLQQRGYDFYRDRWGPGIVRLVTSFRTTSQMVDGMVAAAREIAGAK